jgi:cathepsin L
MTNDEFRKVYHGHKPLAPGTFPRADLSAVKAEDLPDTVDWVAQGKVTATKNQKSCGSCWAFSVTETMESMYAIQNNATPPILAPQQLVDCMPNPDECGGTGGCEGATQQLGFNYTVGAGLTLEASYPYTARDGTCKTTTPAVKNGGMVSLKTNDYTDLATAVATVGPIAISVAAGGFGWQIYGGGVYNKGDDFEMDHAVQLTGYGIDDKFDHKMYWSVRNSWGPSWGEGGYIRLERFGEGKEPCGYDKNPADGAGCKGDPNTPIQYCGMCGVLSSSSYPTDVVEA